MAQDGPWTIGRLLQWTTEHFKKSGSLSPRLDAEVLLAHVRGCSRIELYTSFSEIPGEEILGPFRALVKRRAAGEPVAYMVGYREFYSLRFEVTPDVLIPRPETEFVVMRLLDLAKEHDWSTEGPQVLDVGTGSGVIAVCVAKHLSIAQVTALDTSEASLEVARRNVHQHGVADRVRLLQSDLLSALPEEPRWDFVASNPPYVSEAEYAELPREVRGFEPRLALVGGPTGTELIARLVAQAIPRLRPQGSLILEISPMIAERTREIIQASGAFDPPETTSDLAGLARVIRARRLSSL